MTWFSQVTIPRWKVELMEELFKIKKRLQVENTKRWKQSDIRQAKHRAAPVQWMEGAPVLCGILFHVQMCLD